ncbi:MAG: hypothetical protein G8237_04545 [Magnetococcales bacterium]|nr:hypothetical protein [Magnetococcales bacterium]
MLNIDASTSQTGNIYYYIRGFGNTDVGFASYNGDYNTLNNQIAAGEYFTIYEGEIGQVRYYYTEQVNITGIPTGNDLLIFQDGTAYHGGSQAEGGYDTFFADWSDATTAILWENNPTVTQVVNGIAVSGVERLLLQTGSGDDRIVNGAVVTDNTLHTGAGNDTVRLGAGSDTVISGSGNDTIQTGRFGSDDVNGGDGSDTLTVDASAASTGKVSYYLRGYGNTDLGWLSFDSTFANIQTQLVSAEYFTIARGDAGQVRYTNIEHVNVTAMNKSATNDANDLLVVQGGSFYHGGSQSATGYDTFYADWSSATTPIIWDNNPAVIQVVNGITVSGMERLLLATGSGNDRIANTRTVTDDTIYAGAGNDTIETGGGGSDYVDGGPGTDLLTIQARDNTSGRLYYYIRGLGNTDNGFFHYNSGFTQIQTALATAEYTTIYRGEGSQVRFYGIEKVNITGMNKNATNEANDLLICQSGTSYRGGTQATDGYDTFYANWSQTTAAIIWENDPTLTQLVKGITVSGLERLLLATGSGEDLIANTMVTTDDTLLTGAGADTVHAGAGADWIESGSGNDLLDGGTGIDTLIGGTGNDIYQVTANDIIQENSGEGIDLVKSPVSWTLGDNLENLTLTGSRAVSGTGNARANTLAGNSAANLLTGNAGTDTLRGLGGADTLFGGDGNDTLSGGDGNDRLIGGNGNDQLTGGPGSDQFLFNAPFEKSDTITDFSATQDDKLVFVSANFDNLSPGILASTRFRASSLGTATSSSQRFLFQTSTGVLRYDPDGNGPQSAVAMVTLPAISSLSATRILIASG